MINNLTVRLKKRGENIDNSPILLRLSGPTVDKLVQEIDLVFCNDFKRREKLLDAEYGYYTKLTPQTLQKIIDYYNKEIQSLLITQAEYINNQDKIMQTHFTSVESMQNEDFYKKAIKECQSEINVLMCLKNKWVYQVRNVYLESNSMTDFYSVEEKYAKFELVYCII